MNPACGSRMAFRRWTDLDLRRGLSHEIDHVLIHHAMSAWVAYWMGSCTMAVRYMRTLVRTLHAYVSSLWLSKHVSPNTRRAS
jgi:hypothetical protein